MTDEEIRALLGDAGVRAGNRLYELANETEHANRMVEGAKYMLEHGDVAGALRDLEIARGAAERAVSRLGAAVNALRDVTR